MYLQLTKKPSKTIKLTFLRSIAVGILFFHSLYAADIKVTISGIEKSKGNIILELFSSAKHESFPIPEDAIAEKILKADSKGVSVVFKDIPTGEYAISVIHDVNSNKTMDTSFLGIPTEPYGNSGEYTHFKPNYEESKFSILEQDINITIEVH